MHVSSSSVSVLVISGLSARRPRGLWLRVFSALFLLSFSPYVFAADTRVIEGTRWSDQIDESASPGPVEIYGRGGADTIWGSAFGDTIEGGGGNDSLSADDGDDVFIYTGINSGLDAVSGGAGYDRIIGSTEDDTIGFNRVYGGADSVEEIDGGAGQNLLEGSRWADNLDFSETILVNIAEIHGMEGGDMITGSNGDDTIAGGPGNDTIYGREGDDTFAFVGQDGDSDMINGDGGTDRILGSPGNDIIGLRGFSGANSIEMIDGGNGEDVIKGTQYSDLLDFGGTDLRRVELIDGDGGADSIVGSQLDDVIAGGDGSDTIDGGAGFDTAVFAGKISEHEIFAGNSSTTVIRILANGSREIDTLIAMEQARFADGVVAIGGGNRPPTVVDDVLDAVEDTEHNFLTSDLLANDSDPDGDPIRVSDISSINGGQAALQGNGSIVFMPDLDFNGDALFSYVVEDNKGAARSGQVTVRVAAVNDPPVAEADSFSGNANQEIVFDPGQFLANDSDVDGDPLGISAVSDAVNCRVVLDGLGKVVFTPDADFEGQASFSYEIDDGAGGIADGMVTINIGLSFRIVANNRPNNIVHWDGVTGNFLGVLVEKPKDTQLANSVTLGPDGNLYVGWSGKGNYESTILPASVRQYDPVTGEQLGIFATFEMEPDNSNEKLDAMVFAPNGQLLVFDNIGWGSKRKLWRFQGLNEPSPGAFVDLFITRDNDGFPGEKSFEVWDLDFDAQGRLLVPRAARHEILIYSAPEVGGGWSCLLDVFASVREYGANTGCGYEPDFGGFADPDVVGFDSSRMTTPYGIGWGPDGNLYVSVTDAFWTDTRERYYLGRIMYYSPTGEFLGDFVSTDEFSAITLDRPQDLDFGPDGNLYVATKDANVLVFGAPNGPRAGQHIGTLVVPEWVKSNGSTSLQFIVD